MRRPEAARHLYHRRGRRPDRPTLIDFPFQPGPGAPAGPCRTAGEGHPAQVDISGNSIVRNDGLRLRIPPRTPQIPQADVTPSPHRGREAGKEPGKRNPRTRGHIFRSPDTRLTRPDQPATRSPVRADRTSGGYQADTSLRGQPPGAPQRTPQRLLTAPAPFSTPFGFSRAPPAPRCGSSADHPRPLHWPLDVAPFSGPSGPSGPSVAPHLPLSGPSRAPLGRPSPSRTGTGRRTRAAGP